VHVADMEVQRNADLLRLDLVAQARHDVRENARP
jgi:hypothetical protein